MMHVATAAAVPHPIPLSGWGGLARKLVLEEKTVLLCSKLPMLAPVNC